MEPTTTLTTAEANRIFYAEEATAYEATEACVRDARYRRRLRTALAEALDRLEPDPLVLDACGGSGNVGEALHGHGVTPVVVDLSPEMAGIWRVKAADLGVDAEIHEALIEDFLRADGRRWNLITFSSALHHLEDYTAVMRRAAGALAPGGLLFTMFDPTLATPRMRLVRRVDFVLWLVRARPARFIELLAGAARRAARPAADGAHVGRMAERYAYTGIDDAELVRVLAADGLEVLVHERYCDARLAVVRFLLRLIDEPSSFRLLLRRPPETPCATR